MAFGEPFLIATTVSVLSMWNSLSATIFADDKTLNSPSDFL
jgi:hypothetical protein